MNHIQVKFSIKDLENLSGIKAHTIRIWEKRYELLAPERTGTNIRFYSLDSLKKLLNVAFLNKNGYKISKIAAFNEAEFVNSLNVLVSAKVSKDDFINNMKISMLNFDTYHFESTYQEAIKKLSFSVVFEEYFIPFLNDIGLLWQSGSINPTHEHFISNLIKQKTLLQIEALQKKKPNINNKLFVLFLPDNEVHDLGLNYLHYKILEKGYKSIMLGASVPTESLLPFVSGEKEVFLVSYFTVKPSADKINTYLSNFSTEVLKGSNANLSVLGKQVDYIDNEKLSTDKIKLFHSIKEFTSQNLS